MHIDFIIYSANLELRSCNKYKCLICIQVFIWFCGISGSVGTISHTRSFLEKAGMVPVYNASQFTSNRSCIQSLTIGGRSIYTPKNHKRMLVSCVKTSEPKETEKSNGEVIIFWNGVAYLFLLTL